MHPSIEGGWVVRSVEFGSFASAKTPAEAFAKLWAYTRWDMTGRLKAEESFDVRYNFCSNAEGIQFRVYPCERSWVAFCDGLSMNPNVDLTPELAVERMCSDLVEMMIFSADFSYAAGRRDGSEVTKGGE
jgi:hypothetical protein